MIRRLPWALISSTLALALILAGCGNAPAAQSPTTAPEAPAQPTAAPTAASVAPPIAAPPVVQADTLRLLWWQAPTILNPHLATGGKDFDASRVTYEPLASFNADGDLVPFLAAEIPTLENGGVAADGTSVTWKLKPDIKWSDGEPFTAEDVKFTYEFISNPETAATTASSYSAVTAVEVVDPLTVKVVFGDVTPNWAAPFVGGRGLIIPKHVFEDFVGAAAAEAPANLAPVGTGPYRVIEFKPGDIVIYEANPFFREAAALAFSRVELKGGGDATSAARAVLQTGDVDFAWNLQVEAQILTQLEAAGQGRLLLNPGGSSERIELNQSDPNVEIDGERSSLKAPHPFLTDSLVRQAFALAVDRQTIADQLYGASGTVATNIILSPKTFASPNTTWEFSLEKAAALLDEAGWVDSDGDSIRDKDGVKLAILFQTSANPVRQKSQEIIKQALESIGWQVELKAIDNSVYFSNDPTNPDTFTHFYADVQMYTTGNSSPDPGAYLEGFTCAKIAQKANNWASGNLVRWCSPEYDALFAQSTTEIDPDKRREIFIQLNDLIVESGVVIPLIHRTFPTGVSNTLSGVVLTPWDSNLWLLKDWRRIAP